MARGRNRSYPMPFIREAMGVLSFYGARRASVLTGIPVGTFASWRNEQIEPSFNTVRKMRELAAEEMRRLRTEESREKVIDRRSVRIPAAILSATP